MPDDREGGSGSQQSQRDMEGDRKADMGETGEKSQNAYNRKKNFIKQRMDIALLITNFTQLRAVLATKGEAEYYNLLVVFITLSIILQAAFVTCSMCVYKLEEYIEKRKTRKSPVPNTNNDKLLRKLVSRLDVFGYATVLVCILLNIAINTFVVYTFEPKLNRPDNTTELVSAI